MSDKVQVKVGDKVRFSVGRARTSYEGKVKSIDGAFAVTVDEAGNVRKVRPGALTVI